MPLDKFTLITEVSNSLEGIIRKNFEHINNNYSAIYAKRQAKAASFLIESFGDYESVIEKASAFAFQACEEVKPFGCVTKPQAFSTIVDVYGKDYPFTLEVEIRFGSGFRPHVEDPESDFCRVTNTVAESIVENMKNSFPNAERIEPRRMPNPVGKGFKMLIEHGSQKYWLALATNHLLSVLESLVKQGKLPLFYDFEVTADDVKFPFNCIVSLIFSFEPESNTTSEEQNAN